jgi:hypothetical protein
MDLQDLACEDAQCVNVWLAKAVRGEPLPSINDPAHQRTRQAVANIMQAARENRAAAATVSIALASMLLVLDALDRTAEAERQAKGKALN